MGEGRGVGITFCDFEADMLVFPAEQLTICRVDVDSCERG